jgi:hypothetical protein
MPSSLTSGSSIIVSIQNTDVDIGLRYGPKSSALPIVPQSISRGARFSRLHWFATATACQVAGPPCTDLTGLPANGGFYFQAFDGSVTLPVAGYDYNSVWTPLLAGLPPAGMAASLAALVRPCSCPASKRSWRGAPKTRSTPCLRHPVPRSPVIGIDIGKNSFHVVGHDARGAIVLRQKWSRGQVEARLANIPPCLIGMDSRQVSDAHHQRCSCMKGMPLGPLSWAMPLA